MNLPHSLRFVLVAILLFFSSSASAQKEVRHVQSTVIYKDMAQVENALLAYGQWCDKGCRYKSPGVVVDKKIRPDQSANHFYTWTWISDVKDVKYFSEIRVQRTAGKFVITSRALGEGDKKRIKSYEKLTGHPHSPAFDGSVNVITLSQAKDAEGRVVGTNVTCETRLVVSGFLELFAGKVKKGIAESTQNIFAALRS